MTTVLTIAFSVVNAVIIAILICWLVLTKWGLFKNRLQLKKWLQSMKHDYNLDPSVHFISRDELSDIFFGWLSHIFSLFSQRQDGRKDRETSPPMPLASTDPMHLPNIPSGTGILLPSGTWIQSPRGAKMLITPNDTWTLVPSGTGSPMPGGPWLSMPSGGEIRSPSGGESFDARSFRAYSNSSGIPEPNGRNIRRGISNLGSMFENGEPISDTYFSRHSSHRDGN